MWVNRKEDRGFPFLALAFLASFLGIFAVSGVSGALRFGGYFFKVIEVLPSSSPSPPFLCLPLPSLVLDAKCQKLPRATKGPGDMSHWFCTGVGHFGDGRVFGAALGTLSPRVSVRIVGLVGLGTGRGKIEVSYIRIWLGTSSTS